MGLWAFNGLTLCGVVSLLDKCRSERRNSSNEKKIVKFWQIWVWPLSHRQGTKISVSGIFLGHTVLKINAISQNTHSPATGVDSSSLVGWSTKYRTMKAMQTPVMATKRNISIFSRVLILFGRLFVDSIFPHCSVNAQSCAFHDYSSVARCFK